jgi:hypothetical protein
MAERALDPDRGRLPGALVEEAGDPDDRVGAEQFQRRLDLVEVDRPALDRVGENLRERADVDLQTELERRVPSRRVRHAVGWSDCEDAVRRASAIPRRAR